MWLTISVKKYRWVAPPSCDPVQTPPMSGKLSCGTSSKTAAEGQAAFDRIAADALSASTNAQKTGFIFFNRY